MEGNVHLLLAGFIQYNEVSFMKWFKFMFRKTGNGIIEGNP